MRDFTWSYGQKKAARVAFDLASQRDTQAIRREVEGMLQNSKEPRVVWQIEDYLYERRAEHDRVFDYRYSVLIFVFAGLVLGFAAERGRVGGNWSGEGGGDSDDAFDSVKQGDIRERGV